MTHTLDNSPPRRSILPRLFAWLFIGILGVGLVIGNVRMLRRLDEQVQDQRNLDVELQKLGNKLTEQLALKSMGISASESNGRTLTSMYSHCVTPEDFFVVHPDRIFAASYGTESGGRLLVYVPKGDYRFEFKANPIGLADMQPISREFSLQGGQSHVVDIRFEGGNQGSTVRIDMNGQPWSVIPLPPTKLTRGWTGDRLLHSGGARLEHSRLSAELFLMTPPEFRLVYRTEASSTPKLPIPPKGYPKRAVLLGEVVSVREGGVAVKLRERAVVRKGDLILFGGLRGTEEERGGRVDKILRNNRSVSRARNGIVELAFARTSTASHELEPGQAVWKPTTGALSLRFWLHIDGELRIPANDRTLLNYQLRSAEQGTLMPPLGRLEYRDGWFVEVDEQEDKTHAAEAETSQEDLEASSEDIEASREATREQQQPQQPNPPMTSKATNVFGKVRELPINASEIRDLAYSPRGDRLASAGYDGLIRIWDTTTFTELHRLAAHSDKAQTVAFSPNGKLLASGGFDNQVKIWNAETGELQRQLAGHTGFVGAVRFGKKGTRLISSSGDKSIRFWDVESGQPLRKIEASESWVSNLSLSQSGTTIASSGGGPIVRRWDVETGQRLGEITIGGSKLLGGMVTFANDSKLVIPNDAASIRIWDLGSNAIEGELRGHRSFVTEVAISPDGRTLASAGGDSKVILWDLSSGMQIQTLSAHRRPVRAVVFSPDGATLCSAGRDGKIVVWKRR